MLENSSEIKKEITSLLEKPSHDRCKEHIRNLIREQNTVANSEEAPLLIATMINLSEILKDNNVHPRTKLQSNLLIMYLVSMMDPDVYDCFLKYLYPIFKGNCMYNKHEPIKTKGEDFFKKTKFFTESSQKNELRRIGASFIIFSLETVYVLAKYYPYEAEDDHTPTKYLTDYEYLLKAGVEFPEEFDFQFFSEDNIAIIEENLQEVEKQFYSSLMTSQINARNNISLQLTSNPRDSSKKMKRTKRNESDLQMTQERKSHINEKSLLEFQKENSYRKSENSKLSHAGNKNYQNQEKIAVLEEEKKKLEKEIEIQRRYFEDEISKIKLTSQEKIYKYEKKIVELEDKLALKDKKISSIKEVSLADSKNQWAKEKIIEELQVKNRNLEEKVKQMEQTIKNNTYSRNSKSYEESNYESLELEVGKLKKQNKALKVKLLSECEETSEFTKKGNLEISSPKNTINNFIAYEDVRSSFEPFYSNSSTQMKIRLKKAILREKELLYKDKIIEIGTITKLESQSAIKLTIVFTNVSQKPLFNFAVEFVARDDLLVKVNSMARNYLEISGQTKAELFVTANQIDFRCLLSSIRYNLEGNTEKLALIMPISKLKFSQQQVYTPISEKKLKYMKKVEKIVKPDRKVLPNLSKFKDYFANALLETDKTLHEVYHLKVLFMDSKFYVQTDEVESQLRIAIKYFEQEKLAQAQKLMDQLTFLFTKGS